jgi:hypothetical protein
MRVVSGGPLLTILSGSCNFSYVHAKNAMWYDSNREIHEDLELSFFANHIRKFNAILGSKMADAGKDIFDNLWQQLAD